MTSAPEAAPDVKHIQNVTYKDSLTSVQRLIEHLVHDVSQRCLDD